MIKKALVRFAIIHLLLFSGRAEEIAQGLKKPMNFMDILGLKSIRGGDISPNKQLFLYEISALDWKENKLLSDLYIVSTSGGPSRQMTFTKTSNEAFPKWHPSSSFFAFLSDRSEKNQIFFMRPDGGEAWQVTEARDGVSSFDWNEDGSLLAYLSGKDKEAQIWLMPGGGGKAEQLTDHDSPVESWFWSPDGKRIYFIAPESYDETDGKRIKEGFDVRIIDPVPIPRNLWVIDVRTKREKRLTESKRYSVQSPVISDDGRFIAFVGKSTERFADFYDSEVYLIELLSGKIDRITDNHAYEGDLSFSPDGRWLAYIAPAGFIYMRKDCIYLYPTSGGKTIVLPEEFDLDASVSFWNEKGDLIFFDTLSGMTNNLFAVSTSEGSKALKVTNERAHLFARKDKDTGLILITYSDPHHPRDIFLATEKDLKEKQKWIRLTEANPQVNNLKLAEYEIITWKSTDGKMIEGILIYPLDYEKGKSYPLIVQIHGGPASPVSAYTYSFSGSYGTYTQVFAANGYAIFQPNYRGSSGYGEEFRMEIAGDFFRQAYEDIMSGVNYLINRGIADPEKLGMMGWSAGGHWSNWTLVSTDRFKAISTGAGAVNWVSLYGQSDVRYMREFYFKGTPYNNWDHYLEVSPLRYIKKAKTPTLIHFGEKDGTIPMAQGQELHVALKKLGVPVEFVVYPNMPHGLTNPRYQLVKMVTELSWFERWIKGKETWFDWCSFLSIGLIESGKVGGEF